jgi:hypothetical protein
VSWILATLLLLLALPFVIWPLVSRIPPTTRDPDPDVRSRGGIRLSRKP